MKKLLVLFLGHILLAASCRKETVVVTPPTVNKQKIVFKNDSSLLDKSVTVPATQVTHTLDLPIGTSAGVVLLGGYFKYTPFGITDPSRDIRNVVMKIKQNDAVVFTTATISTIVNGVNTLPQLSVNLGETKTYRIELVYDVLSSATDGVGAVDGTRIGLELYYSHKDRAYDTIAFKNAQAMTFTGTPVVPNASFESSLDNLAPPMQNMKEQEEKGVMSWLAKAKGGDISIREQRYRIEGSAASAVTSLKLYDSTKGSFIAEAPVVNNTAVFSAPWTVSADKTTRFSVKAVSGTVDASVSSLPFKIVRDEVKYQLPSLVTLVESTDIAGSNVYVFKSLFTITHIPLSTVLANGRMELYRFGITGMTGHKQFTFEITLNDLGVNDTLSLKDFDLYENGVSVKSRLRFTDAQGVVDTVFTESDSKLYITYTQGSGETQINGTKTFSFFATFAGYKGSTDGDGIAIRLLGDASAPPESHKYLNNGGLMFGNAFLASSPFGTTNATPAHFIFSDMSATPHNGQFNTSTNDWTNGARFFPALSYQYFY